MSVKIFYHSSDPDGWCSAAIIKHEYQTADLYPINYGEPFPWSQINKTDDIWMADFCLQPFEDMITLKKSCKSLTWIDHHISALNAYKESGITLNGLQANGRGACELVWKFVYPDTPIPRAVDLIASYDVWDHSNPDTVPFIYGIRSFKDTSPTNALLWNTILFFREKSNWKIEAIINRGAVVLDYIYSENADYVQAYSFETEIDGYRVIACNRGIAGKKLFDAVWDDSKYDIACTFCRLPSKKWTVSLYSDKPNVDVSKIAVKYGGGGHAGASGCQVDELPFCF